MACTKSWKHDNTESYQKDAKAVKIATLESGVLVLIEDELRKILCDDAIADVPISVLAVLGIKRVGKSVLASMIVQALDGEKNKQEPVFEYSAEEDTCTRGIYAWNKLLVNSYSGENCATLVLDTQGTGDGDFTVNSVVNMFVFCMLTSSLVVYSVDGGIGSDDLDKLALSSEVAREIENFGKQSHRESTGGKIFQDLTVLVHNFKFCPTVFGFSRGESYLNKAFADSASVEMQVIGTAIRNSFQRVQCCVLPDPGNKMREFTGNLDGVDEDYVREIKLFIPTSLKNVSPVMAAKEQNSRMTCAQWFSAAMVYQHALTTLSSENIVRSGIQNRTVEQNLVCYDNALKLYDALAGKEIQSHPKKLPPEKLSELHHLWSSAALKFFDDELTLKECKVDDAVKERLIATIHKRKQAIDDMNEQSEKHIEFVKQNPLKCLFYAAKGGVKAITRGPGSFFSSKSTLVAEDEDFHDYAQFLADHLQNK